MLYKMIAIDLDGTLLDDNKSLSNENIRVLNKLNNMGIEIVIATGRRYYEAKELTKDLNMDLVILANNGNIVRQVRNDNVLYSKVLDNDDFYLLINKSKENNLYPLVYVDHYENGFDILIEMDSLPQNYNNYISSKIERVINIKNLIEFDNPRALSICYIGEIDVLNKFASDLTNAYPNKYSYHIMSNLTKFRALLEIMHPEGCKWKALIQYAKSIGISKEKIITIGDDNNDVEMIKNASLGIGMLNSCDNVKSVADIITSHSNNESGVAKVLENVFSL